MEISFFEVGKSYRRSRWPNDSYFTVKYVGDAHIVADLGDVEVVYGAGAWLGGEVEEVTPPTPVLVRCLYRDGFVGTRHDVESYDREMLASNQSAILVYYSDGHWELETP